MQASSLATCRANNLSPKQSGTGAWGLLTLIIIRAISKAYSPSCCSWMCPWLGILIAQHPADTSLFLPGRNSGAELESGRFAPAWHRPRSENVFSH